LNADKSGHRLKICEESRPARKKTMKKTMISIGLSVF
jgi:hypothetical protein